MKLTVINSKTCEIIIYSNSKSILCNHKTGMVLFANFVLNVIIIIIIVVCSL